MAAFLVRTVAALFFSQSLYGIWWIWHYDYPRLWQISYTIGCVLQCLVAHRLWSLKRWIVVYLAVTSGIAVAVFRLIPALGLGLGWQLYYLIFCLVLTIVATQEWKRLKNGL